MFVYLNHAVNVYLCFRYFFPHTVLSHMEEGDTVDDILEHREEFFIIMEVGLISHSLTPPLSFSSSWFFSQISVVLNYFLSCRHLVIHYCRKTLLCSNRTFLHWRIYIEGTNYTQRYTHTHTYTHIHTPSIILLSSHSLTGSVSRAHVISSVEGISRSSCE